MHLMIGIISIAAALVLDKCKAMRSAKRADDRKVILTDDSTRSEGPGCRNGQDGHSCGKSAFTNGYPNRSNIDTVQQSAVTVRGWSRKAGRSTLRSSDVREDGAGERGMGAFEGRKGMATTDGINVAAS
jgi:hypothetical protein